MEKVYKEERIHQLDFLRGISAIFILFWHYQHFNFIIFPLSQPFYDSLIFFYREGHRFVDLFFIISGYIFFYKYLDIIAQGKISFKKFILLRLSRLYPLLLLTLIVVAVLQYINLSLFGRFFIYDNNDVLNFVLNLLFLQSSFFSSASAGFNAPTWSLAVEFWVYIAFFLLAKKAKYVLPAIIFIVLYAYSSYQQFALSYELNQPAAYLSFLAPEYLRGLGGFFLGGILYFLLRHADKVSVARRNIMGIVALIVSLGIYVLINQKFLYPDNLLLKNLVSHNGFTLLFLVHPLLCAGLLLVKLPQNLFKHLSFIGDWSFGIYLWHIPVMLTIILLYKVNNVSWISPTEGKFMVAYIGIVLLTAFLSFRYFERPAQRFLRSKFTNIE